MAGNSLRDNTEIVMGQSPPGVSCNTVGAGLPLLNGPTEYGPHHPSPFQFTTDARKRARAGDVLFCVRGSTTGRMNWADQEYAIGRGVAAIRHKTNPQLQPFVRAVIEYGLPDLLAQATGSTFPNVSIDQIARLRWPPFDSDEQRAIAHIIGTLDDKIELSRRMNETLEAMALALFRSWFVDFDPVRAKAEGRDPGLPKPIAALFPPCLVNSGLGQIPEGWMTSTLGSKVTTIKGRSYKSEELAESDTALVTLKSFARGGGYKRDGLKPFTGTYKPEQVVKPGDLVLACTDVTQAAEVIGRPVIVRASPAHKTLVASLDTMIVRPRLKDVTRSFLYFLMSTQTFIDHTYAHTTGTTVLHLAKDAVPSYLFVCPPKEVIRAFDQMAGALLGRARCNEDESYILTALRDTLLPKLISGELRLKDAEQFIGRAV